MFAVIELQWHQYIVRENDTIVVDKLELTDSNYTADKVLLIAEEDGTNTLVGKPYIKGATVSFNVVTDFQKGEKIRVLKFKRKNRYQRIIGFRPHQTVLEVKSIAGSASKAVAAKKTDTEETPKKEAKAPATKKEAVKKTSVVKKETVKKTTPAKKVAAK
jgi:large subunit ribosomal protein L21